MDRFGGHVGTDTKADGTPVSEADRGCEQLMRAMIAQSFPGDRVFGEEFGDSAGAGEVGGGRWVLDPIDGTQSFIRGVPLFGTLIGWEVGGEVMLGAACMPALGELLLAWRGGGAWRVRGFGMGGGMGGVPQAARVSATRRVSEACVLTTSIDYFRGVGMLPVFEAVTAAAAVNRGWSDCYAPMLVAMGLADAAVEPVMKPYDVSPFAVIVPEAGGAISGFEREPALTSPTCVYSNGVLHEELLGLIRGARGTK